MLDLAFIIEKYFEFGGLQRDMRRFALGCAKIGHNVTIFTSDWNGPRDDLLKIELVDFSAASNHQTVKNIERFAHLLRKKNSFDCITGFNRVGGLDVYFGGDPCLKAKMQRNRRSWLRFLPRYRTYLEMEASVFGPESDTDILLISPTEYDCIRELYNTDAGRLHLMPPGIDRERITGQPLYGESRQKFRLDLGVAANEFMVLTIGSNFHTKGIDRAIKAIGALPTDLKSKCKYVVVGDGKEDTFQKLADVAGIGSQIVFTGGRTDVGGFYYAADLLLHAARTETAGHTLLESMMTSLPVLVTEHCGYARYVKKAKGGVLCPDPFKQSELDEMVREILISSEDRTQYGENGIHYCETADIYSMTENVVKVILDRAERNRVAQ